MATVRALRSVGAAKRVNAHIHTLLLLAAVASGCGDEKAAAAPEPRALAVRVTNPIVGPLREELEYVGTVHGVREARVVARIPGALVDLPIAVGEPVRAGDVVAVVGAPELGARVSRASSEAQRATTERDLACRRAEADARLHEAGAVATLALDASRGRCDAATLAVDSAHSSLAELRAVTSQSTERAPFAGRVLDWLAEPGENVTPGRPLLLVGSDDLEIHVPVIEQDVVRGITAGSPVRLTIRGRDAITTHVGSVAPMRTGPARTVEVRVPVPPELASVVAPGASIDVAFVLREEPRALSVPAASLRKKDGRTFVYVVGVGDRVREVPVDEQLVSGDAVAIRGAVTATDSVVVGNLDILEAGTRVYPVPAEREGS